MKMSKTVKKLSAKVEKVMNQLDDLLKLEFPTYKGITHSVKFDLFPGSLFIECKFESVNNEFSTAIKPLETQYQKKLQKLLIKQGIVLKVPSQNLAFICEQE